VEAEVDRIEPEAVDAPVQPEAQPVEHRAPHVRVVEVEVGLRGQEVVQVILAPARFPLPGHAAEDRQPVVRWRAVVARVGPDVPVGARIVAAFAAFAEPRVLVGRVAEHLVDHDPEAARMRLLHEPVEIRQRAEQRIDVAEVGDVVAEIGHRRLEEWRHPDRIDPEARDVVQARDDARQIADAVVIGVLETARIDLVDDGTAPPRMRVHSTRLPVVLRTRRTRAALPRSDASQLNRSDDRGPMPLHTYSCECALRCTSNPF
jgi:hypothetical protein